MHAVTLNRHPVTEGTTALLTGVITREDGVTGFRPDTCTMTLREKSSGQVIHGRDGVDIRSSVDEDGSLSLELTPSDNAIVTEGAQLEIHQIEIEWSWAPNRVGRHVVEYPVQAL